jgi:hypothetical protein
MEKKPQDSLSFVLSSDGDRVTSSWSPFDKLSSSKGRTDKILTVSAFVVSCRTMKCSIILRSPTESENASFVMHPGSQGCFRKHPCQPGFNTPCWNDAGALLEVTEVPLPPYFRRRDSRYSLRRREESARTSSCYDEARSLGFSSFASSDGAPCSSQALNAPIE